MQFEIRRFVQDKRILVAVPSMDDVQDLDGHPLCAVKH